jgi:hypothetical protein
VEEDIRARTARERLVGMDILRVCVVVGAGGSQNHFYFSCGSDLKWLYSEGTACLLGLLLPLSRQTKHHSERRRFKTGRFYASGFIVHRHLPHACLALQPFRMLKRTGKQKATGMLPPRVTLDTAPALPVAALSNTRPMPYNPSIRKIYLPPPRREL